MFRERPLYDPDMVVARHSIDTLLAAHEPNPALAIDRHWTLIAANKAVTNLVAGAEPILLRPPINVLRLSLHPAGLAPRIANLRDWRDHVINRLRRQIDLTGDTVLSDLLEEILDYPLPRHTPPPRPQHGVDSVAVPFRLVTIDGTLSFLSTTTVFGTPTDVTLSEIAIETFFPADAETADIMRRMADGTAVSRRVVPLTAAG